jgi:hypothetical protein
MSYGFDTVDRATNPCCFTTLHKAWTMSKNPLNLELA